MINCLNCGKVYDLRDITEEGLQFLQSGRRCVFCGEHVDLNRDDSMVLQSTGTRFDDYSPPFRVRDSLPELPHVLPFLVQGES